MAKRSIQGYVELASGLGEMTASRAKSAASEILALSGADQSSKKLSKQANKLAEDLMAAATTNRQNLVSLVRREVDAALGRLDVNRIMADLQVLSETVGGVAAQVEEITLMVTGRSKDIAGEVVETARSTVAEVVPEPARVGGRPPRAAFAHTAKSPAKKVPARKAASTSSASAGAPAKKAPAKKAAKPATKAAAKKAAKTTQPTATKSTATKSTATKTAAKRTPAKAAKSAATKTAKTATRTAKSTAKRTPAKAAKSAATKSTASSAATATTKRAPAKRATKKAPATKATGGTS
jgi:hypothetical protein